MKKIIDGVRVPTDLNKIETKVIGSFTKRQVICFGLAALVGVPVFFGLKGFIGNDLAAILMVAIMMPFFLFAMYKRNGVTLEKYLYFVFRQKVLRPQFREYRYANYLSEKTDIATHSSS